MKKLLLIFIPAFLLSACYEEKTHFEQAVLHQMQADEDIKDYHLDTERMTQCVVEMTSDKMPGLFPFDPRRESFYEGYAKMLELKTSKNPQAVLKELRDLFGSGKAVAEAHTHYSESTFHCINTLVSETEDDQREAEEEGQG
ncbi:MAG: hypothetical protein ACU826_01730 [Gammaproteobacteria bacterium]